MAEPRVMPFTGRGTDDGPKHLCGTGPLTECAKRDSRVA